MSAIRWLPPPANTLAAAATLSADLGLSLAVSTVLASRGFRDPTEVRSFLRPTLDQLHDPLMLPDMSRAIDRINSAVDSSETILVHGDYDADGMSAAALVTLGLQRVGAQAVPFVPHRTRDGYDFGESGIERARAVGATLVITVDCGTRALEPVSRASSLGIDVIVTDHHRVGPELPAAVAVVNPRRADSDYPFPALAGVGVAFKLVSALYLSRGIAADELNQHLDLVSIGTVADQMPLRDENRALVRAGCRVLARTRKPGLRALMERADVTVGSEVKAGESDCDTPTPTGNGATKSPGTSRFDWRRDSIRRAGLPRRIRGSDCCLSNRPQKPMHWPAASRLSTPGVEPPIAWWETRSSACSRVLSIPRPRQ